MRKRVVEPLLGKKYHSFIRSQDDDYQRQLEDIVKAYKVKNQDWAEAGWSKIYSSGNQGNAWTCPEKEIIKAEILDGNKVLGALYMKAEKIKK